MSAFSHTIREDGGDVGVGLEPEHQGVVVLVGTQELVLIQQQAFAAVKLQRNTCGAFPTGAYQHEIHAARSLVVTPHALTFVQRIVILQTCLVAGQPLTLIIVQLSTFHGAVPQAEFEHLALIQDIVGIIEVRTQ